MRLAHEERANAFGFKWGGLSISRRETEEVKHSQASREG